MTTFLDEFIAYLQAQDRSPHTVKAYRSDVAAFFDWLTVQLGRPVPPIEVTAFDVQHYRDHLVAEGRKPAGVNRALAALRVCFAWAMQTGQASTNPARDVQGLKQAQRTPQALTQQEVYRLQREAAAQRQLAQVRAGDAITPTLVDAIRDEALLNLLLYTGLRVSECAALRMDDVVLNGKVIVRSGKGRKYREVPLHKEARKAVAAYLAVRPTERGDMLFLGQRGRLGARGIQFRIAALAQELGGTPAQLPTRSRQAYQWLKFLSDPLTLVAQLETQRALYQAFQSPHCDRHAPRRPVQLEFAYTTALYHVRRPSAGLQVTVHAGFLGAPAEVLQSLACAVLLQDRGAYRETVQTYATAPEFLAVVTALELTTGGAGEVTQGRCFDLTAVFARVNAMYFAA